VNRQAASAQRVEGKLAAVLAALPLLYLLTEHSWRPVVWHYSALLLSTIAVYTGLYAAFLWSYRWPLPAWFVRIRSACVTIAFGVIVAFLFAEVMLEIIDERPNITPSRLLGYEPDPDTGYVFRRNYEQEMITSESFSHWRSNSLGVRADRDFGPKPPGVVRILALGDSFTVSHRTEVFEAWPALVEQALPAANPGGATFESVNAGHPGWGTVQQFAWYKKYGFGLRPDIVLVALTPNDITDNGHAPPGPFTALEGNMVNTGSTPDDLARFLFRQRWYSLPGQLERSHVWEVIRNVSFTRDEGPKLAACHEQLDPEEERLHRLTEQYVLQIRDLAAGQGASIGLLLLTFREQLGPMAPGYSGAVFGRRWMRFAQEHGIPAVDTYDRFRAHSGPPLYWRWDAHYTQEGNRLAAQSASDLVSRILELRGTESLGQIGARTRP
jgi:hypothetical protein